MDLNLTQAQWEALAAEDRDARLDALLDWESDYYEAEARAEQEAEARNERFWEERGADDGFDEWEARRGVLSYEAAREAAYAGTPFPSGFGTEPRGY